MKKKLTTLAFLVSVGNMAACDNESPPASFKVGDVCVVKKGPLHSPASERRVVITGTSEGKTLDEVLRSPESPTSTEFSSYMHSRGRRLEEHVFAYYNPLEKEEFFMGQVVGDNSQEKVYLHATYLKPAADQ